MEVEQVRGLRHPAQMIASVNVHVPSRIGANGFGELRAAGEHAVGVAGLPPIPRDPFDRLLNAQSQVEGIPIVTSDPAITRYEVDVIW